MEKRKTDASVKAGLQIEADNKPLRKRKRIPVAKEPGNKGIDKEIDVDDVVHEPEFEPTAVFNKENSEVNNNEEKDADDLVHGK